MKGQYKQISILCIITLAFSIFSTTYAFATKLGSDLDKNQIVKLIEKEIPAALNFTIESEVLLPDFTKLNGLINNWNKGDPAAARAQWLAEEYVHYDVKYQVDTVEFFSPFSARIVGKKVVITKKLCRWADNCLCQDSEYSRFLWSDLKQRKRFCIQKFSDKKYMIIMAQKNPAGHWEILSEDLLKEKPKIGNKDNKDNEIN